MALTREAVRTAELTAAREAVNEAEKSLTAINPQRRTHDQLIALRARLISGAQSLAQAEQTAKTKQDADSYKSERQKQNQLVAQWTAKITASEELQTARAKLTAATARAKLTAATAIEETRATMDEALAGVAVAKTAETAAREVANSAVVSATLMTVIAVVAAVLETRAQV